MTSVAAGIPYLLVVVLAASLLWGSILAVRGRRWWATVIMVAGSGLQVTGALMMVVGMVVLLSRISGMGSSASLTASAVAPTMFILGGGAIMMGLGFLGFAAGFIGFCARSGAAERRAAELEGLVTQLQQRVEG